MGVKLKDKTIGQIFKGEVELVNGERTPVGDGKIIKNIFAGEGILIFGDATYRLLADVDVTANTTQIDFDNLDITKDDEVRLVYTFVGDSSTTGFHSILYNNVSSNYTNQRLSGVDSSVGASRNNDSVFAFSRDTRKNSGFLDIKISNNSRFVAQSQFVYRIGSDSSSIAQYNYNIINTNTVTNITKLSVVSSRTNGIAVGSRLTLYKVVR